MKTNRYDMQFKRFLAEQEQTDNAAQQVISLINKSAKDAANPTVIKRMVQQLGVQTTGEQGVADLMQAIQQSPEFKNFVKTAQSAAQQYDSGKLAESLVIEGVFADVLKKIGGAVGGTLKWFAGSVGNALAHVFGYEDDKTRAKGFFRPKNLAWYLIIYLVASGLTGGPGVGAAATAAGLTALVWFGKNILTQIMPDYERAYA